MVAGSLGLLRRSWTVCAVGVAMAGAAGVAGMWAAALNHSLPAEWAREKALIEVTAEVTSDARQWQARGYQPAAAVLAPFSTPAAADAELQANLQRMLAGRHLEIAAL